MMLIGMILCKTVQDSCSSLKVNFVGKSDYVGSGCNIVNDCELVAMIWTMGDDSL
jgi:hypothetical protein